VSQGYHLAQINVGRFLAPIDSPQIRDFVDNLDRINALAESQPGFVWRLVGEGNNATDVRPFEDPDTAVNLSVWESLETLAAFVYRTAHRDIMRRRREWFSVMET
jgi:heme-degrading monooxygenase HmoA